MLFRLEVVIGFQCIQTYLIDFYTMFAASAPARNTSLLEYRIKYPLLSIAYYKFYTLRVIDMYGPHFLYFANFDFPIGGKKCKARVEIHWIYNRRYPIPFLVRVAVEYLAESSTCSFCKSNVHNEA